MSTRPFGLLLVIFICSGNCIALPRFRGLISWLQRRISLLVPVSGREWITWNSHSDYCVTRAICWMWEIHINRDGENFSQYDDVTGFCLESPQTILRVVMGCGDFLKYEPVNAWCNTCVVAVRLCQMVLAHQMSLSNSYSAVSVCTSVCRSVKQARFVTIGLLVGCERFSS
jgi:hypothetical protein